MKSGWKNTLKLVLALALLAGLAVLPVLSPSSVVVEGAQGRSTPARADADTVAQPQTAAAAAPAAMKAAKAPSVTPAPAAAAPRQEKEEPQPAPAAPGVPTISALNPSLPGPTNLTGVFYPQGWGNSRNNLSWTKASPDTGVIQYIIPEWTDDDFSAMIAIFNLLAVQVPAASGPAASFATHTADAMQPGLTVTERQDIADLIELDLDALFAIITANSSDPVVQGYWDDLIALATLGYTGSSQDKYQRNKLDLEKYYFYVVLAEYAGGDTSPPSNSWGIYAYWGDGPAPAQPTGFTAYALAAGVVLDWNPNTELDLAGYNVYVMQGGTPVKLNTTLITQGTMYFHSGGTAGSTYLIEAVNMAGLASTQASFVALAPPVQIFDADNPTWDYIVGQWAREDYSSIETGGRVLRVAETAGSRASLTFTVGHSMADVRVYSARYWSCGNVNYYIDGTLRGSFNLYYDGGYFPYPGPGPYVPPLWQQLTFEVNDLSRGTHTLVIECVGSGGGYGEDYVNFDYAEVQ